MNKKFYPDDKKDSIKYNFLLELFKKFFLQLIFYQIIKKKKNENFIFYFLINL